MQTNELFPSIENGDQASGQFIFIISAEWRRLPQHALRLELIREPSGHAARTSDACAHSQPTDHCGAALSWALYSAERDTGGERRPLGRLSSLAGLLYSPAAVSDEARTGEEF